MAYRRRILGAAIVGSTTCLAVVTPAIPAEAAFPGHNGKLVYAGTTFGPGHEDGVNEVFILRRDGTSPYQLTSKGNNDQPRWGPFGHRIVYTHRAANGHPQIWVMGAHGRHKRRLPGQGHSNNSEAAWAPGGHRIVFTRSTRGSTDLVVYSMDTHKVTALHVGQGFDRIPATPAWSPDGALIAFSAFGKGDTITSGELYVVRPDGAGLTQITNTPHFSEEAPNWSPDSRKLTYGRRGGKSPSRYCEQLDIVNADGTGRVRIHAGCSASEPAWSPNGRQIVAYLGKQRGPGVWIMGPHGRHQRFLVSGGNPDLQPRR